MIILGLGSNIGDRRAQLGAAIRSLSPLVEHMRLSRVLESTAVLPPAAPAHWNLPFLNMAIAGDCALAPEALLAVIKAIERDIGRKERGKWGPREIDIDILAMDGRILTSAELTVPHPQLLIRDFALLPLIDVAPDWRDPASGDLAADIARAKGFALGKDLRDTGIVLHAP